MSGNGGQRPVTGYAKAPDGVSIAYRVTGEGPLDVLFLHGVFIPVDLMWDEPGFLRVAKRLGGFSRTVWCDPGRMRPSGGDYRDSAVGQFADADITAVLDAAGCERVVLVASGHAGPTTIHYAATRPERVAALVLINTYAHYVRESNYPCGSSEEALERYAAQLTEGWGAGTALDIFAPGRATDESLRAWWSRSQRLGLGPEQIAEAVRASVHRDVRSMLTTLAVPTLVVHRMGDRYIDVCAGRHLGEHIVGATYVELEGDDHLFFVGDTDAVLDEVEEFLTGGRQAPEGDVVTATILFTDIVNSTAQEAAIGRRAWARLADSHDAIVRAALQRHRGREVKTTGDGFLATFDATTRAVRAATQIVNEARDLGLELRAGLHSGEVEVRADDVAGLAVAIAKRICDLAGPGQVLVSETVKGHLVGSGITTSEQGTHVLKGVPDEWRLFGVAG